MERTPDDARLTFRMGDVYPADEPLAVWAMTLAIALGDLRVAGDYAVRGDQADYERIYFARVFSSHLREIVKLLERDYGRRQDVKTFVDSMPEEAQQARRDVIAQCNAPQEGRPGVTLLDDLKRIRNDTFHYAHEKESVDRLTEALRMVADLEGDYVTTPNKMRAGCADLVVVNRMHLFGGPDAEWESVARAMHRAIVELLDPVAEFLLQVEAHYLHSFLIEDGPISIERR